MYITQLAYIPMRAADTDRAEMVSQLLFGQPYTVITKTEKWIYVKSENDGYNGWIDLTQHVTSVLQPVEPINNAVVTQSGAAFIQNQVVFLPVGSTINTNLVQPIYNSSLVWGEPTQNPSELLEIAKTFLNTPYIWGGKTNWGCDCSGFVQSVFNCAGINIPRDAYQQAEMGSTVNFITEVQPLDLAFFDNAQGKITHVGIMLNPTEIIHASGWVKIESIDQEGIFSKHLGRYSHKLRIIKRINAFV